MAVKFNFPPRKFLDVTQAKPNVFKIVTANIPSDTVKISVVEGWSLLPRSFS